MIVITLTDCPVALRGDLTRWLQEINTGVYVGRVSARVRDSLWDRIVTNVKNGRATMVYRARNEQHLEFRVHNTYWRPIDYDGITLMLRPHRETINPPNELKKGFSKASKRKQAKHFAKQARYPSASLINYAVIDLETTGFSPATDEIIEVAALTVNEGFIESQFHSLVSISRSLPKSIVELTGLTDEELSQKGQSLSVVLEGLMDFIGELPIVMHNANFDMSFLKNACQRLSISTPSNPIFDTLKIAKELIRDAPNYNLQSLLAYFDMEMDDLHRGVNDCIATHRLFDKLNKIESNWSQ